MMIQAVLSNPNHPEYGVATIPFPIPHDQYAHCMELLEALEVGDAVKADCKVEKIDSFYTVLKRTKMLTVNVEELNYLAKRLDGFDAGEAAQFQAMAHKLELFELKDLINLTFCCQQATVITDFSDLAAIGRDHYMNLHGGSASVDELNALDGKGTARQLIESGSGTITPYGVVYDNGMKLWDTSGMTTRTSNSTMSTTTPCNRRYEAWANLYISHPQRNGRPTRLTCRLFFVTGAKSSSWPVGNIVWPATTASPCAAQSGLTMPPGEAAGRSASSWRSTTRPIPKR